MELIERASIREWMVTHLVLEFGNRRFWDRVRLVWFCHDVITRQFLGLFLLGWALPLGFVCDSKCLLIGIKVLFIRTCLLIRLEILLSLFKLFFNDRCIMLVSQLICRRILGPQNIVNRWRTVELNAKRRIVVALRSIFLHVLLLKRVMGNGARVHLHKGVARQWEVFLADLKVLRQLVDPCL